MVHNKSVKLPEYINQKIETVSGHFGQHIQDLIETSILQKTHNLDEESVYIINGIFSKQQAYRDAINESLTVMIQPKSKHAEFWNSILEQSSLDPTQKEGILKIKSIFEADAPTKESIEGDGEDPNVDDSQPAEQDGSNPDEQQTDQDGNPVDQNGNPVEPMQPQLSPEQQLQIELTQTDNKFMTISLYNSINELIGTIETILENVSASKTEENLDLFTELSQYKEYLDILAELIFVMDLNTVYYNFTNISLEVNALLDKYLISTKVKILNDKETTPQTKKDIIDDLKQNLSSKIETNKEMHDEEIKNGGPTPIDPYSAIDPTIQANNAGQNMMIPMPAEDPLMQGAF